MYYFANNHFLQSKKHVQSSSFVEKDEKKEKKTHIHDLDEKKTLFLQKTFVT
jgi:hypothetical protein